jgi:simple sugar transport system ATP-binding protein
VHVNADRILHMAGGRIVGEYDPRTTRVDQLEAAVYA